MIDCIAVNQRTLYRIHDDERKLIGRAVTAAYMPARPDLFDLTENIGHE